MSEFSQAFKKHPFFANFTEEECASLVPFIHREWFEKGEWIYREADFHKELVLIEAGTAELLKEEEDVDAIIQLAEVGAGDWVGEMGFIEKRKRFASMRALTRCVVLFLDIEKVERSPACAPSFTKISNLLAKKISSRLRSADNTLIGSIREKIELISMQNEVGHLIVYLFLIMTVYLNLAKTFQVYIPEESFEINKKFYPATIVLLAIPSLWMLKRSKYRLSFYGLTLENGWRYVKEALFWSAPLIGVLVLYKWFLINYIQSYKELPLFHWFQPGSPLLPYWIHFTVFILVIPLQELIARSLLQVSFKNFFQSGYRVFFAILCSNLLFNIFHTVGDIWFAIALFSLGLFWGYLFERQKSIVGVTVSHAILGVFAYYVLDFEHLLAL